MNTQYYDAIMYPGRTTMKIMSGSIGKLYGNVGKMVTKSNLSERKPCFNIEHHAEGAIAGNQSAIVGTFGNAVIFGRCGRVILS